MLLIRVWRRGILIVRDLPSFGGVLFLKTVTMPLSLRVSATRRGGEASAWRLLLVMIVVGGVDVDVLVSSSNLSAQLSSISTLSVSLASGGTLESEFSSSM